MANLRSSWAGPRARRLFLSIPVWSISFALSNTNGVGLQHLHKMLFKASSASRWFAQPDDMIPAENDHHSAHSSSATPTSASCTEL
ncbi:hypothetical protein G7K_1650-t1 [Saitoella complicata NRRL Y-17804]|uniref:Uncharacterized protein n=1 Tax=Saitoella complicata (strain BCRC 22490 / CBS 7301 / JCM 7358 / NBRC 10748 / NRRL Y-17804) TaxID=698492 RepID=A0A0E9NCC0_SAICN|nr:hypothetical protein G7K_1650-t1 [Saitoella complicata NRRL Y-17804]